MADNQLSHDTDPSLVQHIESLGLKAVDEYVAWCRRHGFSQRTKKNWRERLKERTFLARPIADARLAQRKLESRKPEKIIERIFQDELTEDEVQSPTLKAVCRAYESSKSCLQTKQAFTRIFEHFPLHFLSVDPVIPRFGDQDSNTLIGGLLALARQSDSWRRLAASWKPQTHNAHRQFSSLARHLLADWPVPSFMDSVWFKAHSPEAMRQQDWFRHIGMGNNIRTVDVPLKLTKKMAHHFMQAPPEYTVETALRWAQIHGLGGDSKLVKAICGTRLGDNFEHDDFWVTVLQFFVNNPVDRWHVGPIIDYIRNQKFVPQEAIVYGLVGYGPPRQPDFSMKGRTLPSLLRDVHVWHGYLAEARYSNVEWPRSSIDGFEFVERLGKHHRLWTITELTSTKALIVEGRSMRHCVASYASLCIQGDCSIWTVETELEERRAKVLTIEVDPATKVIRQISGKRNALPKERHLAIIRRWCEQSGLTLAI